MLKIIKIIGIYWLFLFGFSLINFSFLAGISIPVFWFLTDFLLGFYGKFFDFFIIPIIISTSSTLLFYLICTHKNLFKNSYLKAFWINIFLWTCIIISFESYKTFIIHDRMRLLSESLDSQVECHYQNPFLYSLAMAGEDFQLNVHAVVVINGTPFLWSYKQQNFFYTPSHIYVDIFCEKEQ